MNMHLDTGDDFSGTVTIVVNPKKTAAEKKAAEKAEKKARDAAESEARDKAEKKARDDAWYHAYQQAKAYAPPPGTVNLPMYGWVSIKALKATK